MNVLRTREPTALRPRDVVMISLVVMTVAGGALLLSAAKPTAPVDGAIEWHEESPLRALVELLCLNYQAPTYYAGAVKNFILAIGAGLAVIVLSVVIAAASPPGDGDGGMDYDDTKLSLPEVADGQVTRAASKFHVTPLIAAQVLVALYLLWSFASRGWSLAPDLAMGGSILLTIQFLWAFGLGNGLSASAARLASRAILAILAVTAAVAIWYHYGRNPTLRADFPVGNPTFLGACLIPGILISVGITCEKIAIARETRRGQPFGLVIVSAVVIAVLFWAFYLADARGPYVGLFFGVLAMAFFAIRGRAKLIPVLLAVGVGVVGWLYLSGFAETFSPTGRSATLRLRTYAWSYAWQMFNERPFTGHGQGGFALAGDSYAVGDVLDDPLVFESRIAHAHNEWLEVMADLGSVGIVLAVTAMWLTFRAGQLALAASPSRSQRWALLALMGALAGLIVEESFGVGLRVSGVGTMFYTVIGLIWALSANRTARLTDRLSATRGRRMVTGVTGGLAGLAVLAIAQQDFAAARNVYRAKEAFVEGDYDEAIRLAPLAVNRLNPQRALTGLFRLSDAHRRVAQILQDRGADRERRARETEPPNPRLMALADVDRGLSEEHCKEASEALKQLVIRSPGFINHGRLGYWINLVRAGNAAARNDTQKQQALLKDAAAAIKRELLRQPFNPSIAVDYLGVAGPTLDLQEVIEVLARPLRHHGLSEPYVTEPYVALLRSLAADPQFDRYFSPLMEEAKRAVTAHPIGGKTIPAGVRFQSRTRSWAPEKLRLAAVIRSIRGDYQGARDLLEPAAAAYETLAKSAPLGAAGCYHELAICRFFSDPSNPEAALKSADRAIALAPESRLGRRLKLSVTQRMVDYHLAADNEEVAKRLLRETGPPGATEDDLLRELAARYRRMCESLLGRREAGGALRKPPKRLATRLAHWIGRAIELDGHDPFAHYIAADLAFYVGDEKASVDHLRNALDNGLPVGLARQFLQVALDQEPDNPALQFLWMLLTPKDTASEGLDEAKPVRTPSRRMPLNESGR